MEPDHVFLWHIENFSSSPLPAGKYIYSLVFNAGNVHRTRWFVRLYPRGHEDLEGFVSFELFRVKDHGPDILDIEFQACVVATDGSEIHETEVFAMDEVEQGMGSEDLKLVKRNDLMMDRGKHLPEDTLTIKVKLWRIDPPQVPTKTVAKTAVKLEEKCFTWTVENFGIFHRERKIVVSTIREPELFEMFLTRTNNKAKYAITIRQKVHWNTLTYVDGRILAMDSRNKMVLCAEGSHVFPNHCIGHTWTFPTFIDIGELRKARAIPGGVLRLHCDFLIFDGTLESSTLENSLLPKDVDSPTSLEDHMKSLHDSKDFADVILRVRSGHTFRAHKWILGARSPVFLEKFQKMEELENDNIEAPKLVDQIQVLEIDDLQVRTLKDLLKFVYTDTVDLKRKSFNRAFCLYSAAQRYQIPQLRLDCVTVIKSKLDFDNVFQALSLAAVSNDSQFVVCVHDYIAEHSEEVLLTDVWQDFAEELPTLAQQVLCHLRLKAKEATFELDCDPLLPEED